jgi:hypothetical protein
MNIFKLKLYFTRIVKNRIYYSIPVFSFCERHSLSTPMPITNQIKQLVQENDKQQLRSFLIDNFFNSKSEINFYDLDFDSEKALYEIITKSLSELNFKEKIKISNKLTQNKKYFWPILSEIIDEIIKTNEQPLTKENLHLVNDSLNSIKIYDKEILARGKKNIDRLFESIEKNLDNYKNIFSSYPILFHNIFNKVFYIESILLHKKKFLSYDNTTELYNKISQFIIENFENVSLSKLGVLLYDMDCAFYKNDELNEKIIDMIIAVDKEIDLKLKTKIYKDFLHTMTSNRIFEKIKREKSLKVIEIFSKCLIQQIRADLIPEIDLYKLFKYSACLHSILLNELKVGRKSEIIIKLDKILDYYIDRIYQIVCLEQGYKSEADYMNFQNAVIPLNYLMSLNHKSYKLEEIMKDIFKNKKIIEQNSNTKITFFHRDFLKYLIRLNIPYQVEDKENYISKDVIFQHNGFKVCVELDGKFHYYRDGTLEYGTLYKKRILENFGWKVINLKHSEWSSLDGDSKLKYVKEILDKVISE